jgi:thiol-disulfide isomerase/thioredoxin
MSMAPLRNKQILLFIGAGIAALVAGYLSGQFLQRDNLADGEAALVEFAFSDSEGKIRNVREWDDRALLINFWATWCAPCREEIPELVDAQTEFGDAGLQVLGFAVDRPEPVSRFMEEMAFNYPSLVDEAGGMELMARYGNPGSLPFTLAFNREGRLVGKKLGRVSAEDIRTFVDAMLPAS